MQMHAFSFLPKQTYTLPRNTPSHSLTHSLTLKCTLGVRHEVKGVRAVRCKSIDRQGCSNPL
jgi:hypothetical protein